MHYGYLAVFTIYCVFILIVGLWASTRITSSKEFSIAGGNVPLYLCVGTFVGTFLSAVTVVGGIAYASQFGWSYLAFLPIGLAVSWVILVFPAKKFRELGVTTIPEMLEIRYESSAPRVLAAALIICMYAIWLITQLFGIAIVLNAVIGLPVIPAILIVGGVFVVYVAQGGYMGVIRTDLVQSTLLYAAIIATFIAVVIDLKTSGLSLTSSPKLNSLFTGNTSSLSSALGYILTWGFGVSTQSYYLHRFLAAKDVKTARNMIGISSVLLTIFYLMTAIIGIGIGVMHPELAGNDAFPRYLSLYAHPVLAAVALIGLSSAVMSTTDSLLHIVGTYFSRDIFAVVIPKAKHNEKLLLVVAKLASAVFGIIVTATAAIMAVRPIPQIAVFGSYAYTLMTSGLWFPIYLGLYWKRANNAGAVSSIILGVAAGILGRHLKNAGIWPIDEVFLGLIVSIACMVLFAYFGHSPSDSVLRRFFKKEVA